MTDSHFVDRSNRVASRPVRPPMRPPIVPRLFSAVFATVLLRKKVRQSIICDRPYADRRRRVPARRSANRADDPTSTDASRSQTTPHQPSRSRPAHSRRWRGSAGSSRARGLPEQQIASLCNVSRTPVRAALAAAGRARRRAAGKPDARLSAGRRPGDAGCRRPPNCRAPRKTTWPRRSCATARRAAWMRRSPSSGLVRRYRVGSQDGTKIAKETVGGQSCRAGAGPVMAVPPGSRRPGRAGRKLRVPPAARARRVLTPGFRLDGARAAALRQAMEALLALARCRLRHRASSSASTPSSTA